MSKIVKYLSLLFCVCVVIGGLACNKLVEIPAPINSITASQVFNSDNDATSAVVAIYRNMSLGATNGDNLAFSNGGTTIYPGLSADELADVNPGTDQFLTNTLLSNNTTPYGIFWQPAYFDIYMANAVISNLQISNGVTTATKNQLIGEAKFLRALCYFYLTNIYGGVPLALSTDFNKTALLPRASDTDVYNQITADLKDAQGLLASDYSFSNGAPTRATKWAALALLARVDLYSRNWTGAYSSATSVINSGNFQLDSLDQVFSDESSGGEAILQLETVNSRPWATAEGYVIEPPAVGTFPGYQLQSALVSAFEAGDQRWTYWVDSVSFSGITYYYPTKYKVFMGNTSDIGENYMVLRLAEQYLDRAEAEANGAGGGIDSAIADLNVIRTRAGLGPLLDTVTDIMAAVRQERRIELFAEWGNRWFDLKRWGLAVTTLGPITYKMGNINANQLLYPIPLIEIQDDPNLIQNPGYASH